MKTDFVINADWTGGGGWRRATVKINTKRAAEAYNEYYGTERRVNDIFIIENDSYNEFDMMLKSYNLSSTFK